MPKMTPDYEVRLQLDPEAVLNSEHGLESDILEFFKVSEKGLQMNVQFLDKCCKDIYNAGWCVRIRKVEEKPHLELTYKKRYDINNGTIDETLSISREKQVSHSGKTELELPGPSDSRKMAIKEEPDKFDDWGPGDDWGTKTLAKARVFGPVLAKRWIGEWNDIEVYIEVWPIPDAEGTGTECIVEASFKTDSYKTASAGRINLTSQLQAHDWVLAEDSLKTKLILERCSCSKERDTPESVQAALRTKLNSLRDKAHAGDHLGSKLQWGDIYEMWIEIQNNTSRWLCGAGGWQVNHGWFESTAVGDTGPGDVCYIHMGGGALYGIDCVAYFRLDGESSNSWFQWWFGPNEPAEELVEMWSL
ncbi:uncharacterized protein Triagg1_10158 [Trichoderma aggressivum f. europaeum]|uniref:Uncharacterized protein n=1 Tax=Trichoderma aggressivum f. europaeum TaxID=173218 RepID=A0AAE1I7F0_9HYPO|nr:hypothetical protein Triagg1_10158 [Trichoderma aggressivum f. europaeum]